MDEKTSKYIIFKLISLYIFPFPPYIINDLKMIFFYTTCILQDLLLILLVEV